MQEKAPSADSVLAPLEITADLAAKATRTVRRQARDAYEAEVILDMLGLDAVPA